MSKKRYSNELLFEQLTDFVKEKMPKGEVCMKMIAHNLSLSPSQLNRRVKSATGIPVNTYVMNIRIEKAKELLTQSPKYIISDVSRLCGFADTAHFSHAFHRIVGISPTNFIKENTKRSNNQKKTIME